MKDIQLKYPVCIVEQVPYYKHNKIQYTLHRDSDTELQYTVQYKEAKELELMLVEENSDLTFIRLPFEEY